MQDWGYGYSPYRRLENTASWVVKDVICSKYTVAVSDYKIWWGEWPLSEDVGSGGLGDDSLPVGDILQRQKLGMGTKSPEAEAVI